MPREHIPVAPWQRETDLCGIYRNWGQATETVLDRAFRNQYLGRPEGPRASRKPPLRRWHGPKTETINMTERSGPLTNENSSGDLQFSGGQEIRIRYCPACNVIPWGIAVSPRGP